MTIGEKDSRFYLIPSVEKQAVVTDILPFELIQGVHASASEETPILLKTIADLIRVYPEITSAGNG